MTSHTSKPVNKPKVMSMLAEDQIDTVFRPTPVPTANVTDKNATEEVKGRALNITASEHQVEGNVVAVKASGKSADLSDVSISSEEEEDMSHEADKVPEVMEEFVNKTLNTGKYKGKIGSRTFIFNPKNQSRDTLLILIE